MAYEGPRSHRPLIIGRRGAVASNHPLATQAGLLALQAGGNAVDAAVAVATTLSVVEPFMSGLGGDGFYHVYLRRTGESVVFNGTGPAPGAATPERYAAGIPASGPLAASVPGSVGAWGAMHARFGRRPWASLLEAAIHYARDGFGATRAYRHFTGEQVGALRADPRSARVFLRDGVPPDVGTPIVQPDLAQSLGRLAEAGADDFYRGELARALAAGCQAAGSLITAATSPRSSRRRRRRSSSAIAATRSARRRRTRWAGCCSRSSASSSTSTSARWAHSPPTWSTRWSRRRSSPSPTGSGGVAILASWRRRSASSSPPRTSRVARRRSIRSGRRRPARRPRPATPRTSAWWTATATRCRASRASTAPSDPA